jgi:hypothetical protein
VPETSSGLVTFSYRAFIDVTKNIVARPRAAVESSICGASLGLKIASGPFAVLAAKVALSAEAA